jgi:hypothetical protein
MHPKLCPNKTYNAMNTLQNDNIYKYIYKLKKKLMTDDYNCFVCFDNPPAQRQCTYTPFNNYFDESIHHQSMFFTFFLNLNIYVNPSLDAEYIDQSIINVYSYRKR